MKDLTTVNLQDLHDIMTAFRMSQQSDDQTYREIFEAYMGGLFLDAERPSFDEKIAAFRQNASSALKALMLISREIDKRLSSI